MDKMKFIKDFKKRVPDVSTTSCEVQNAMLDTNHGSLKYSNDYLCPKKAAAYLSVTEATLRNWCSNGQIVYYKLGRQNRFLKKDLDSLLSRVNGKDKRYGNQI